MRRNDVSDSIRRVARQSRVRPRPAGPPGGSLTRPIGRAPKPSSLRPTTVVVTPDTADGEEFGPEQAEALRRNLREAFGDRRSDEAAAGVVGGFIERGRPFSLYLRNFSLEAHKVVKPLTADDPERRYWSYFGSSSTVEQRLGDVLQPAVRMIGIANPADPIEASVRFPRLEVVAPDWERIVGWLIEGASFIVFDLDSLAPGVAAELELVADLGRADDTVVVLPPAGRAGSRENPLVQGLLRQMGGVIRSDPTPVKSSPVIAGFSRVATEDEIQFDALAEDPRFGDLLARHERELRRRDSWAQRRRARFLMTYGLWSHSAGDPDEALETYAQAEELFTKANDAAGYAEVLMNMGRAGLDLGLYEAAIDVFKQSGTVSQKYGDSAGYRSAVAWVGLAYFLNGDTGVAVQVLMKALELENDEGRTQASINALETLARIYETEGDRTSAANVAADLAMVERELAEQSPKGRRK